MSEKTIKQRIKEAEVEYDTLLNEKLDKARKKVNRLQKRESVRDALGRVVKQPVRNARGELLNRVDGDDGA